MKYNPNEDLTDEQLKELSEDDFFEYIDSKAAYLKQFTQPLGQYHAKQFASQTKGSELTTKELGDDPKFKDPGIKNLKTHRSQWFD